jgi:hypothetical protein
MHAQLLFSAQIAQHAKQLQLSAEANKSICHSVEV